MLELFTHAGVVAWPLGIASIIGLGIMLERIFTLSKLGRIEKLAADRLSDAAPMPGATIVDPTIAPAPVSRVVMALEPVRGAHPDLVAQSAEIGIGMQRLRLRRYLGTLATIGSTAPFVGLFGTVLGVIAAFEEMSKSQLTGEMMSKGISEALNATALGLLVAIPAIISYNYLLGRVNAFMLQIQADVARIMPLYTGNVEAAASRDGSQPVANPQRQEA